MDDMIAMSIADGDGYDGPKTYGSNAFNAARWQTPGPQTFEQALDEVLQDLRALMISKQRDYGSANINDFGEAGVLVRANDKMARLKNLSKTGATPSNESLDDSWRDLANYGIIALLLRRGTWGLPLEEK